MTSAGAPSPSWGWAQNNHTLFTTKRVRRTQRVSFPPAGMSCRIGRSFGPAFSFGAPMTRVACYVDGFNLYHAVSDLRRQHLKWLDIQGLAQSICRPGEILVKTAYFSAYATWLPAPYARHREYDAALKVTGVD